MRVWNINQKKDKRFDSINQCRVPPADCANALGWLPLPIVFCLVFWMQILFPFPYMAIMKFRNELRTELFQRRCEGKHKWRKFKLSRRTNSSCY